eukprot:4967716-Pleurochrysis_carterae.AAC.1
MHLLEAFGTTAFGHGFAACHHARLANFFEGHASSRQRTCSTGPHAQQLSSTRILEKGSCGSIHATIGETPVECC